MRSNLNIISAQICSISLRHTPRPISFYDKCPILPKAYLHVYYVSKARNKTLENNSYIKQSEWHKYLQISAQSLCDCLGGLQKNRLTRTDDHDGEVKALLGIFSVDVVGQGGKANVGSLWQMYVSNISVDS